ncbi:MAG TPA: hypothetical protein VK465_09280 [Fibrobacteria bacterium]|nr:hypothetical protein [Fibrobacteria bacterium]
MKPKERPLAGYLMARAAMHRKVEGSDLKNLRAGHESLQQGSALLPLGRANVIQDIEKAKESYLPVRNTVASKLREFLVASHGYPSFTETPRNIRNRVVAAASQYVETGTCHSYAASISPLHAAKLPGMKDERSIVALCNYPGRDHVWPEMIPKGKREDGTLILHGKDVIMDAWGKENVAIFREDSEYARLDTHGKGDHLNHHDLLNHRTGPRALKEVKHLRAKIESNRNWKRECDNDIQSLVNSGINVGEKGRRNAESVFHADFQERAGRALHKDAKHASLAEIQAIGVARSLGSNIRGAKAEAPEIIASAKEMFSRPRPNQGRR